ncbi:MAG: UDP-N-acetylmuramoyl-L-alanine--D-glutamate ligase, partial [Gemmatimonadales bacterium]
GLRPAVGVLTNLAPDHLDRYQSVEEYFADKRRLFLNADADSTWIVNADDQSVLTLARGVPGRHLGFSTRKPSDAWFDRKTETLMLGEDALIPRGRFGPMGDHNVENALAAVLAASAAGVARDAIAGGLTTFRPLAHRLEPVREVAGVLWINDSKATNVASTAVALTALDRPFVLVLGGRRKSSGGFEALAPGLHGRCRVAIAYGEAREAVARQIGGSVPVESVLAFDDAVARARDVARPGEAVLLSPACASFDQFTDYEERGDRFRSLVEGF